MPARADILFYDGHCALCHGAVKFVLRRDRDGARFLFAPLQGTTFTAKIPPERRAALPDSLIVLTVEDRLLLRSEAILHICRRLGGPWGLLALTLAVVPQTARDAVYSLIARVRYRLFGREANLCPLLPASLGGRFLD